MYWIFSDNLTMCTQLPPGTIDLSGKQIRIREWMFDIIKRCFETRGGEPIETPVFEYMKNVELLYGGEFNKLVFKLNDKEDNDTLFLRYDLTVPFMRYASMNGLKLFKRYQIGKVYRKDTPQINKGRLREFYQCDFDILGEDAGSFTFDLEVIDLTMDVLSKLLDDKFIIRINHRDIIVDMVKYCNIENNKIPQTIISLDKLDKLGWDDVVKELELNDISDESIQKLTTLYNNIDRITDPSECLTYIQSVGCIDNQSSINNMKTVFQFLNSIGKQNYKFDPFLARGMDYYTGIIYECYAIESTNITSAIAAGGRYDNMYGKMSNVGNIPAIGISIGIERIAKILESEPKWDIRENYEVYIASVGNNTPEITNKKMTICSTLRRSGIKTAISYIPNQKMRQQLNYVLANDIQWLIVIGEREVIEKTVTVKNIITREQKTLSDIEALKLIMKQT